MYAIMIMTALGCGTVCHDPPVGCGPAVVCWKKINHLAQFSTMEECKFFLKHAVAESHHHLQCWPVEDPPP